MATFLVWPGILSMGCAHRACRASSVYGRVGFAVLGGAALALQAHGYAFHALGAAAAIVVVIGFEREKLRHRAGVVCVLALAAGIGVGPYAWRLLSMSEEFARIQPPAGYTSLPVAGLLGLATVPERFRCMPLLVPAILISLGSRRSRPWALAALVVAGAALGPTIRWDMVTTLGPGPLSWSFSAVHLLSRMHHPLRLAPFALASAGVAIALLLDAPVARGWRLGRWGLLGGVVAVGVALSGPIQRVTSWRMPALPRGVAAAPRLGAQGEGPVLDVFGGRQIASLSLQPWHRRPLLETAEGRLPPPGSRWSERGRARLAQVDALAEGRGVDGALWRDLHDAGFTAVLLVERPTGPTDPEIRSAVRASVLTACGAPVYEDAEAAVFLLP